MCTLTQLIVACLISALVFFIVGFRLAAALSHSYTIYRLKEIGGIDLVRDYINVKVVKSENKWQRR